MGTRMVNAQLSHVDCAPRKITTPRRPYQHTGLATHSKSVSWQSFLARKAIPHVPGDQTELAFQQSPVPSSRPRARVRRHAFQQSEVLLRSASCYRVRLDLPTRKHRTVEQKAVSWYLHHNKYLILQSRIFQASARRPDQYPSARYGRHCSRASNL